MGSSAVMFASESEIDIALAAVVVLGIAAMWLGSQIKVPSILLLLGAGLLAGPGTGLLDPDELLGDLLFPAVSLAVGVLLFEGGLGLRYRELEPGRRLPILRLVTIGVAVTWVIGAATSFLLFDIRRGDAVLLAAILTVSGPTVVLPLLRFTRVREPVNSILRWEGIFIDPVGATLAIVVLEAVIGQQGWQDSLSRIATTTGAGVAAGGVVAVVLMVLLRYHWIPDHLQNPFVLMMVVLAYGLANFVRPEAGLFATTVMGVVLANQQIVPIRHIREFEENLGALILASLFVILGARVDLSAVREVLAGSLVLVAVLVLVVRPIAVYLSTVGSGLSFQERGFLMCIHPRGIVAASVSALFAIELAEAERPVDALVPVTFVVIVTTVAIYGLSAKFAARRLRVARPAPRALALIGGPPWALELGDRLAAFEVPVIVVTNDPVEAAEASNQGMLVYRGRLDADDLDETLESVGVAKAIALSRTTELSAYGIARVIETVGRANVFYLPPDPRDESDRVESEVIARRPFSKAVTLDTIDRAVFEGAKVEAVDHDSYDPDEMAGWLPMVTVDAEGMITVEVSGKPGRPPEGAHRVMLRPAPGSPGFVEPPDETAQSRNVGSPSS